MRTHWRVILAFVCLLVVACRKKNEEVRLLVDKHEVYLPMSASDTAEINIESNCAWELEIGPADATWLHVDKREGNGSTRIRLSPSKNEGAEARSAVIVIFSKNARNIQQTIFIEQRAFSVDFVFRKTWGGNSGEYIGSVAAMPDGGYLISGHTGSAGTGDVRSGFGASDWWIMRTNSTGDTVWTKTLGGTGSETYPSIAVLPDGNFVLAGNSSSNRSFFVGPNHGFGNDCWVVKMNSGGDTLWTRMLGGSSDELSARVAPTQDGGVVLAVSTMSRDYDVGPTNGNMDIWVVKLNGNGDIEWKKAMGGPGNDFLSGIKEAPDKSILVGGTTTQAGGNVPAVYGQNDGWVIKLSETGSIVWSKVIGGTAPDDIYDVNVTANGDVLVSGLTYSYNHDIPDNKGGQDAFLAKLKNSDGSLLWINNFGGNDNDLLASIANTADNGCIVGGYSRSNNSGDVPPTKGFDDGWLLKVNANGQIEWKKTIGGSGDDSIISLLVNQDGSFFVGCQIYVGNGDITTPAKGDVDWWLVKLRESE